MNTPIATSPATDEFRALYRANYGFVWHTVRRFGVDDAGVDDALQETFLTAYRRLDRWRGGSPKSWLYAIARRVASNHRRANQRRLQRDGAWEVSARADAGCAHELDALHIVDRFMHELSTSDREVFVLSELEGLGGAEVAAVLAIPASTAYDRIRAVRQRFARHMQERDGLLARAREQRPRATAQSWALLLAQLPSAPTPLPWWASPWAMAKAAIATGVAATAIVAVGTSTPGAAATTEAGAVASSAGAAVRAQQRDGGASPAIAELPAIDPAGAAAIPEPAIDLRRAALAPGPARGRAEAPVRRGAASPRAAAKPTAVSDAPAHAGDETAWLTDAATRLRSGDAAATLALTDRHAHVFPDSALADVRRELRIESLCALGRRNAGRSEAAAWLEAKPRSPFAARAAAACEPETSAP